jgi:nucleoside-diphosphate-sugar epimerase
MSKLYNLKGKSVVVTGATGYIGSALVEELVKHSCEVIRVGRNEMKHMDNTKIITGDVCTAKTWLNIVSQADIIFHLAGNTSLYHAENSPENSFSSTVLPIIHLANAARNLGSKPQVVIASTATIYGLTPSQRVRETFTPKPITVYDLHKLFAELQLSMASQKNIITGVSLRLSNVYGPSCNNSSSADRGILNKVANLALHGKNIYIYGDGNYKRDYIYISDVVSAFLHAGVSPALSGQSFNIASGIGTSVKKAFVTIAAEAKKITGRMVDILSVDWPENISQIERRTFTADIKKFTGVTEWQPNVTFNEGITLLVNDFSLREK